MVKVALWQGPSPAGDVGAGLAVLERAVRAAGAAGAMVLVAPEVFLPGYNQPDIAAGALRPDGDWVARLGAVCRSAGCGLCVGYAERSGNGVANAAIVLDQAGKVAARYRKLQLYGAREASIYEPGDSYAIFDLAGIPTAVLICYDIEFAPHVAALAARGVRLILCPTANMQPFTHVGRATVPAMAANYAMTIVYANLCGVEGDLTYVGDSLVAGADGAILAQAGRGEALLVVDVPQVAAAQLSTQLVDYRRVKQD